MTALWQDIRYGVRMLLKNPGFTGVAVLTLALGIGANTAIFSVVNAVLLKPLPYPEPGQLVQLRKETPSGNRHTMIGSSEFVEFRTQSRSFARIAAYAGGDMNLRGSEQADRIVCGEVTADFFPLLGLQPMLGRNFTDEEDMPNGSRAAILGYALWQSRFGGDRSVLGRPIILNERSYTVVGVLGPTFHFPEPFQLWTPLALGPTGTGIRLVQVIERLNALPGVQAAAATDSLPLTHFSRMTTAHVEGRPPQGWDQQTPVSMAAVTADYFKVMGIPLREGRAFTSQDAHGGAGVVIVNEAFEKHYFPGESAMGKRVRMESRREAPWLTVVGVVGNVRQRGLESEVTLEAYHPEMKGAGGLLSFVIRTTGAPTSLASAARAAMAEVDRNQPVYNVMSMEQRLANAMTPRRLNMILLGSFAAVALILAAVGIYGVMSYAVTQRTREIGMRMALGAQRSDVLRIVVRHGMVLTLLGIMIGLVGSFTMTRLLSALLYEVTPTDPATFSGVTLLLVAVALLACWLPARRAAKIDPMAALRYE